MPSPPTAASIPPAAATQPLDVKAAVDAYLASVPADKRARSDAYFEGGYWLILWDFVVTALVMGLLLHFRGSARMRDLAERITRFRPLQTLVYGVLFIVTVTVITFPWTVYESYFREHKYGLLNQTFGPWLQDQVIMLAVNVVLGALLLVCLFGVVRRIGKNWWVWGAVISVLFLAFASLIAPVFIFPLFNKFTKLEDPHIKDPILSLARANGVPATDVYEFDASRQSDRVSANVSGFAGTTRISLNDNLLKRCTLPEVESTMGHEMGHYVLNHQYKGLVLNGLVIVIGFAFLNWGLNMSLARWGQNWGVRGISDVAVVPLAVLILSFYFLVMTPVSNTITRTMEYEADMYGLNAAQQPDGEAQIDLKLGEYRKLDPGRLEEFVFFDHPGGRTRITAAMRWKAEHLQPAQDGSAKQ
jgi:STE24 endopeptidase